MTSVHARARAQPVILIELSALRRQSGFTKNNRPRHTEALHLLGNRAAVRFLLRGLHRLRRYLAVVLALGAVLLALASPLALAQSISPDLLRSVSPEMLRALQQGQADGSVSGGADSTRPDVQYYLPTQARPDQTPSSRLEQLYLRRSGEFLKQFGYDALGQPSSVSINQSGALPDDYILSSNDELVVTFRGQENSTYRVRVDRDGRVILPKLSPILATGRRFGDFRADLDAQVAQAYLSTKAFVTLGNIHQVSILVSGEVRSPGSRIVSGLASPLDVILLSGGIKKTGSLRSMSGFPVRAEAGPSISIQSSRKAARPIWGRCVTGTPFMFRRSVQPPLWPAR